MEIREAINMIYTELGKRVPLKEEWKEQVPEFIHTYKDISFPDVIVEEEWNSRFMLKLSEISKQYAEELQKKYGKYQKPVTNGSLAYELNLWQAPPTRILSLVMILSASLGKILGSRDKRILPEDALQEIINIFEIGKNLAPKNE